MADETYLLVGLGNPGPQYEGNRHNVGFMAVDEIAGRHNFTGWQKKFHGEVASGTIDGLKVYALKPHTFMNESGRSVLAAATFYKIPLARIVVIHDELELAVGHTRMKKGGGAAGHNGLKSIDNTMGQDYHRLRFGIGRPAHKGQVHDYVLHDFSADDLSIVEPLLKELSRVAPALVRGDVNGVQNPMMLKYKALQPAPQP